MIKSNKLNLHQLKMLAKIIENTTGIHISEQKSAFIESRLARRLRALNLKNYDEYLDLLCENSPESEMKELINAITTNKTEFFREKEHFDFLKEYIENNWSSETIYLWSAACSTGEEPYSLCILCDLILHRQRFFDYRVLATDIDTDVLGHAQAGLFTSESIKDLKHYNGMSYLKKVTHSHDFPKLKGHHDVEKFWAVDAQLRKKMKFRQHNLLDKPVRFEELFHIIFLRNVLIYFSSETCKKVIENARHALRPGGLLFLGHAESQSHEKSGFVSIAPSVLRKTS